MKKLVYLLIITLSIFVFSNKIYAYKSYKIGDVVTYNDIDFYVIKDSDSDSDFITLLKAEPLTVDEVNLYGGVGTDNNHVNEYNYGLKKAYNMNGYGGLQYYSSPTCGSGEDGRIFEFNCLNDYNSSEVKYVIDAWADKQVLSNHLAPDETGYSVRLIQKDEYNAIGDNNEWKKNSNYWYWTMSPVENSNNIWFIDGRGIPCIINVNDSSTNEVLRPVVVLYKCALDNNCKTDDEKNNEIIDDSKDEQSSVIDKKTTSNTVRVPNTLKSVSGLIILIGMVLVCVGLNVFIIIKNKDRNNK